LSLSYSHADIGVGTFAAMPAIRGPKSKKKTRRTTRGVDQVHADVASRRHLQQHLDTHAPEDLPGFGQHYCVECAKFFESQANLEKHTKGKPHKRRLRQLKDDPYSQKEAEAAVGLTTDNGRRTKESEMVDVVDAVV
jgi:bud site selection protein 20